MSNISLKPFDDRNIHTIKSFQNGEKEREDLETLQKTQELIGIVQNLEDRLDQHMEKMRQLKEENRIFLLNMPDKSELIHKPIMSQEEKAKIDALIKESRKLHESNQTKKTTILATMVLAAGWGLVELFK